MKILLLGSGELGKEFAIAAQRIGKTVIAVDSYENAPAMQVAHDFEVINMLDGKIASDTKIKVDTYDADTVVKIPLNRRQKEAKKLAAASPAVKRAKKASKPANRKGKK